MLRRHICFFFSAQSQSAREFRARAFRRLVSRFPSTQSKTRSNAIDFFKENSRFMGKNKVNLIPNKSVIKPTSRQTRKLHTCTRAKYGSRMRWKWSTILNLWGIEGKSRINTLTRLQSTISKRDRLFSISLWTFHPALYPGHQGLSVFNMASGEWEGRIWFLHISVWFRPSQHKGWTSKLTSVK